MKKINIKQNVLINKVKRVPLIIFLKKILPIIVFLAILGVSFLIGFWNVKWFQYSSTEFKNITTQELDSYIEEYRGKNIFLLSQRLVENTLKESNGYIKKVYIKKSLPRKLLINIEEYTPLYIGYSSESCLLFADTGELISTICEECEVECTQYASDYNYTLIISESLLESGGKLIYYEEVYKVERVLSTFKYEIDTLEISDGISVFKDRDNHSFIFDLTNNLETQLARMLLIGEKINQDMIKYSSIDLRFERPVMEL